MGTSRRLVREAREALTETGMGIRQWAELVGTMARGFRPLLPVDKYQLERDIAPRYKPKTALVEGEDGELEKVVVVDERTQFRALKLIADVFDLGKAGVQVNVNSRLPGRDDSGGNVTVGSIVVVLEGTGNPALAEAIRALPAEKRRELALAAANDMKQIVDVEGREVES